MREQRAKKGRQRNACLVATAKKEAAAVKLAKQQEVAMEMKLGEDAAWDRDLYESEYLWWWEKWNFEARVRPRLTALMRERSRKVFSVSHSDDHVNVTSPRSVC